MKQVAHSEVTSNGGAAMDSRYFLTFIKWLK